MAPTSTCWPIPPFNPTPHPCGTALTRYFPHKHGEFRERFEVWQVLAALGHPQNEGCSHSDLGGIIAILPFPSQTDRPSTSHRADCDVEALLTITVCFQCFSHLREHGRIRVVCVLDVSLRSAN